MKKLLLVLVVFFMVGCTEVEVNTEEYPTDEVNFSNMSKPVKPFPKIGGNVGGGAR